MEGEPPHSSEAPPTKLVWFLLGVLRVTGETEYLLALQPGPHPQPLLPQLLGCSLLLLSNLLSGQLHTLSTRVTLWSTPSPAEYEGLRAALSSLSPPPSLAAMFLSLAPSYPLLTLHYCHLSLHLDDGQHRVCTLSLPSPSYLSSFLGEVSSTEDQPFQGTKPPSPKPLHLTYPGRLRPLYTGQEALVLV